MAKPRSTPRLDCLWHVLGNKTPLAFLRKHPDKALLIQFREFWMTGGCVSRQWSAVKTECGNPSSK